VSGVPALWVQLLGAPGGPYEWTLTTAPGERYPNVNPPYPSLDVVAVDVVPVERLAWQTIRVRGDHAAGTGEVLIGRLVAQVAGGAEIEMHRTAIGAAGEASEDRQLCARCGLRIWGGAARDEDGNPYHERCA
jgi:hypothetical protein